MNDKFSKEFNDIKLKRSHLKKMQSELFNLDQRLLAKNRSKKELKKVLEKEFKEYKTINELSLSSLFYTILGTKEKKIEKERQEYLLAKLNFDRSKEEIELVNKRRNKILSEIRKIGRIGRIESEYKRLLAEKEKYLISINNNKSKDIEIILEKLGNIEIEIKETKEAIQAGGLAKQSLEEISLKLKSAKNWGVFDIIGGGIIATAVKHSKVNDAKVLISKTQFLIDNFVNELKDVDIRLNINKSIDIGSFTTFADYFFDGLIFDFVVQEKINNSRNHIEKILSNITMIWNKLLVRLKELEADKKGLQKKRIKLLNE